MVVVVVLIVDVVIVGSNTDSIAVESYNTLYNGDTLPEAHTHTPFHHWQPHVMVGVCVTPWHPSFMNDESRVFCNCIDCDVIFIFSVVCTSTTFRVEIYTKKYKNQNDGRHTNSCVTYIYIQHTTRSNNMNQVRTAPSIHISCFVKENRLSILSRIQSTGRTKKGDNRIEIPDNIVAWHLSSTFIYFW